MKRKCLIILPRHLFPVTNGYANKTYNLLKVICGNYNTKLVVMSEKPITIEEKEFYNTSNIEYFYYHAPKWRFYLNAFLGLFRRQPIQCSYYRFKTVKEAVTEMGKDVDIAIATIIRTIPYLDYVSPNAVKIIDMVDSISLNYQCSSEKTTSKFWKLVYGIETKRLFRFEEKSVNNADLTWYVNDDEAQYWGNFGNTLWTPMAIKEFLFTYDKVDSQYASSVAFFGKMDYQPNVDALLWYYDNVHTKLDNAPHLIVVGTNPAKQIIDIANQDKTITVTGFLDDPYIILKSVKAVVSPMQTGGGMQNKVMETMALAQVNILSSLGALPIKNAEDGIHFLVANSAKDYQTCFEKLNDKKLIADMVKNARQFIGNQYRYDAYKKTVIDSIENIAGQQN